MSYPTDDLFDAANDPGARLETDPIGAVPANGVRGLPPPQNVRRIPTSHTGQLSREDILRRRQAEQDGIPFYLEHDDYTVKVRLLNLMERSTVLGLPGHLQETFLKVMRDREIPANKKWRSIAEWSSDMEKNESAVNGLCVLGFVTPRLVLTEAELDPNDPECWLVTDIHTNDRLRYFQLVTGIDREGLDRARRFLRDGLAGVEDHGALGAMPGSPAPL